MYSLKPKRMSLKNSTLRKTNQTQMANVWFCLHKDRKTEAELWLSGAREKA